MCGWKKPEYGKPKIFQIQNSPEETLWKQDINWQKIPMWEKKFGFLQARLSLGNMG